MKSYFILLCILYFFSNFSWAQTTTYSQSKTSQQDNHQSIANTWHLTAKEVQRYESLMQTGQAKYFWADLDPVMVLGLSAKNDTERERYAEIYTQLMRQRVTAELAWDRAYQAADKRLYPDQQQVFDRQVLYQNQPPLAAYLQDSTILPGDTLTVLLKGSCQTCVRRLKQLIYQVEKIPETQIDLFFIDLDNNALLTWAQQAKLSKTLYQDHRLTLNKGQYYQPQLGQEEMRILIKRGDQFYDLR